MDIMKKILGTDVDVPQIKLRPLNQLVAYARNARTHSPLQIAQLEASLLEWGWTSPVLIDEEGIVAGHGRCMAAEALYKRGDQIKFPNSTPIPIGYVPTLDCSGWSDAQRRAYILADNQLALNAGYDMDLLSAEMKALESDGYNLELIGFDDDMLGDLLADVVAAPADVDPDDAPPEPAVPVSVPGDVWICGAHKVMCGSSTVIDDWDRLMGAERADAVWTDPPYNVSYESKLAGKIKNDSMSDADFRQFLLDAYSCLFSVMKPGAPIYVAHADTEGLNFRSAFREAGFKLSGCLIWRKNSLVLGRSDYQWMHEPILYGWKPGSAHRWYGGRKLTTIVDHGEGGPVTKLDDGRWAIRVGDTVLVVDGEAKLEEVPGSVIYHEKPGRSEQHPTMKPVGLIERMLTASARSGDIVVDAFGGSGSTLIAADRLGMSARLMELDPKFVDVIVRRWEMWSGRRAVHAVTGEEFPPDGVDRALLTKPKSDSPSDPSGDELF